MFTLSKASPRRVNQDKLSPIRSSDVMPRAPSTSFISFSSSLNLPSTLSNAFDQNRESHRQFSESPWNFAFGCRGAEKKRGKCLFTFTQFLCRKQSSEQHTKNVMTSMCNSRERESTRKMYMNNFICFIITKQHMKQG